MKNIVNEKIAEQIHKKYFKLIYHSINFKEEVKEKEYKEFLKTEQKRRDIGYWKDEITEDGYFYNYLTVSPRKLYLVRTYKPKKKHDWFEVQIYELTGE